jgi:FkbM family methyltransferase
MRAIEFARLLMPPLFSRQSRRQLRALWGDRLLTFTHEQTLRRFRSTGFSPSTIYDVGAYRGDWTKTAAAIFPASDFYLFDANELNIPFLKNTKRSFFMAPLSDRDSKSGVPLYVNERLQTSVSLLRERTKVFNENVRLVNLPTRRLDSLVAEEGLSKPDLIKLDVQGSEMDVLKGSSKIIDGVSAIIAEMSFLPFNEGAPLIGEVITYIENLGFKCTDVCEMHQSFTGGVLQMDIIFTRPDLFQRYAAAAGL